MQGVSNVKLVYEYVYPLLVRITFLRRCGLYIRSFAILRFATVYLGYEVS